jgi:aspartate/methionine/tyrosine aminotransferase
VVRLEVGEPDFNTCDPISAAGIEALRRGQTKYTSALGIAPLREAIADYYGQRDVRIDPNRVVITAGASGGLLLLAAALLNPGDEVLVTDPGYPCNEVFAAAVGASARAVPVGPRSRFQPSARDIELAWGDAVRGALLASPANPTGTMIPADALAAIAGVIDERQGFLIIDEIYQGLTYTPVDYGTVLEVAPQAIVLQSFSKYFGMTGWRLGWVVVPEALIDGITRLAQNLFISPPTVAQHAAVAAFSPAAMAEHEARRVKFAQRRQRLLQGLKAHGLQVPVAPDGAFYLYVDVSSSGLDSETFCLRLLDEFHVSCAPGRDFGGNDAERFVRFSYTTDLQSIDLGIERIGQALERFRGES